MTPLHQRNAEFLALLNTLNPAQRQAVEQVEGPVLVIAGPGTGKTHILAARIGKILLDTDTRPQNILCLTFTDAGVHAMRSRLLDMIGPDAYRVPISTFHGFCNRVIQENSELFGKGRLEPVSELERIELVRQLLAKLPTDHPLRNGQKDVFQYENHLRDLFSNMKKERWTPGQVRRSADEFLRGLPQNPDFIYQKNTKHAPKGAPKTAQVQDVTERLQRLKAAADLYPKYLNAMAQAGRYEYEDMILWVLKAFADNEALLRSYQERYLYVQVDEFQDTNGAQYQLLQLLLNFWDIPNAFIVGDDDQSIYEFQGARLENLRHFHQHYHNGLHTIVLDQNYRSHQAILDAAGRVIVRNEIRAVRQLDEPLDKNLHANTPAGIAPRVLVYENRLHELTQVVRQIEALVQAGESPDTIAVLYARHKQATRLMELLGKKGIPFQTKRPVNILELPLIQQFRELLRYLQEESAQPYSGEHRLFRLLHADFFGLPAGDLARIAIAAQSPSPAASSRYDTPGAAHQPTRHGYWRFALSHPEYLQSLPLAKPEAFEPVSRRLEEWIAAVHNLPLPQLLERLFTQSGLLAWVLGQPDKLWHLQALYTFFDMVHAEVNRHPRAFAPMAGSGGLLRLLALLDSMDDNRLPLLLRQSVQSGPGVQLLTAHGAKGLEFRHVFLFDCVEEAWEKNSGGNRGRFALPPALTLSGEEDALEARRRLFYVAMTRAKTQLQISWSRTGEDGKNLLQSRFVEECGLPAEPAQVSEHELLHTQALLLLDPEPPIVTLPEPEAFRALLADFTLSVTALNRYLRCPLAFYYEDFLKIPGAMSEAAAYGVAMHGALQQFLLKMKSDQKGQFPGVETLVRLFGAEMERQRAHFSDNNYAQRLALGRENLRRIHLEQVPYWRRRAIVERRVDRVEFDGIPLAGVIDKLEWLDNGTLRVVDYKTGAPDLKKTAPPDDKQPLGGDYWRQLAFYKILLDEARLYPEPVGKTAIAWLEPDKRGTFPIVEISFSAADLQVVGTLIRDTWANIQAGHFSPGCDREDCPWCRMHRWKEPPTETPERPEEEMDDVM
ncbi:MAG: ATP-dependent helicase [Saprospiraceae bacterium]|nr:ATP-dependent helicase [Saprospiraceae bacterium]